VSQLKLAFRPSGQKRPFDKDHDDRDNERLKLKYAHIEATYCLSILFFIAVGGVVSMATSSDKGLTILTAIISLPGGYFVGVKRVSRK